MWVWKDGFPPFPSITTCQVWVDTALLKLISLINDRPSYAENKKMTNPRQRNNHALKFILLCFDLLTRSKMPFKVMHRKEVTHSGGSYERKSRGRKLADEMGRGKKRAHYTVIDWRTGREWPLNWMTVISARWRSHRPFQRKRKWHIPVPRYRK